MADYAKILAQNVKATRKALDLSQEALALETDIDRTYISGIERAKRNPSLELIVKLAKRLKTTPGKLLTPTDWSGQALEISSGTTYRDSQNEWSGCGTMPAWAKAPGRYARELTV
jgi:transcriptional regulator with XRE-family HTH domain